MATQEINKPNRVFGLDIMRALAILPVIIEHGNDILEKAHTNFPWIPLYDGVEVFFVLSGFLIGSILIKIFCNSSVFNLQTVLLFLKRRWWRTLPAYFLILVLNLLFVYWGITRGDIHEFSLSFFFFCQNLYSDLSGFFMESWSLSVEEWFYLLFPLILMILFWALKNRTERKYIFLLAILFFVIATVGLRVYKAMNLKIDDFRGWDQQFRKTVLLRFDSIGFGIIVAYIKSFYPKHFYKHKNLLFFAGIALYVGIYHVSMGINTVYVKAFQFIAISTAISLTVPKFDSIRTGKGILTKAITHISKISYSIYLVNFGLITGIIMQHFSPQNANAAIGTYCFYLILVVLFASMLYKYFEKPLLDLRDRK